MGAEIKITAPYVKRIKNRYYWNPPKHVLDLGFTSEALGDDPVEVAQRAAKLYEQVKAAREQPDTAILKEGTVEWLVSDYQGDEAFTDLNEKTQKDYRKLCNLLVGWAGDHAIEAVSKRSAKKWYRRMYKQTPAQANAVIRVCRVVFKHAQTEGHIEDNPFRDIELKGRPPRQQIWPDEAIDIFIAKANEVGLSSLGLATRLAADTGQREGDILVWPWTGYTGHRITLAQSKRGAEIDINVLPSLKEALDAAPRLSTQIVIYEATGRPYNEHTFRHKFAEVRKLAGLPSDLWFMDLRRTAVVHLGRGGGTESEISHITGHSETTVKELLKTYLPRDSRIADNAVAKLEAYRKGTDKKPLS